MSHVLLTKKIYCFVAYSNFENFLDLLNLSRSGIALCSCRPTSLHAHSCHLRIRCVLNYIVQVKFSNSISLNISANICYIGVIIHLINVPIAHKLLLCPFYWHKLGGLVTIAIIAATLQSAVRKTISTLTQDLSRAPWHYASDHRNQTIAQLDFLSTKTYSKFTF